MSIWTGSFKKFIGAAAVAAVVVGCAAMGMDYGRGGVNLGGRRFVEGGAASEGRAVRSWSGSAIGERGVADSRDRCRSERGTISCDVVGTDGDNKRYACLCENIPRDLSRLTTLGTAASASECAAMAGRANFLLYHYNPQNRRCAAEWRYQFVGVTATRDACRAATQNAGYRYLIYVSDTQRCFGTQRNHWLSDNPE